MPSLPTVYSRPLFVVSMADDAPVDDVPADAAASGAKKSIRPPGQAALAVSGRKPGPRVDEKPDDQSAAEDDAGAAAAGAKKSIKPPGQAALAVSGRKPKASDDAEGDSEPAAASPEKKKVSIKPPGQAALAVSGRGKAVDPMNDPADGKEPPAKVPLPKAGMKLVHDITIEPVPPQPQTPFQQYKESHVKYSEAVAAATASA